MVRRSQERPLPEPGGPVWEDWPHRPQSRSRASRSFLESTPMVALRVGRLAVKRILDGYGYEMTALDLAAAVDHV